jgi:hypothetical protein
MAAPGGFNDQRVTATMQFPAPTAAGAEFIGVFLRCIQFDVTTNYYFVGLFHGTAVIVKIVAGVSTTIATVAFALAQGVSVTITASAVGSLLTGKFVASGGSPATVTITATDTNHTRGFTGFTSIASAIWVSALKSEQL